ncbi:MAG TPA: YdcF family protein [Victivallales bacterium]|nr:YdcF family protein [Victivallales bacterium]
MQLSDELYKQNLLNEIYQKSYTYNLNNYHIKPDIENNIIVVLGYQLSKKDIPWNILKGRLKTALDIYNINYGSKIIVSGGNRQYGFTEAEVMKEWLVSNGVSRSRVIKENLSYDTVTNGLNSVKILKAIKAENCTLVTSRRHMPRALAIFEYISKIQNFNININNSTSLDSYCYNKDVKEDSIIERNSIYRDLSRIYKQSNENSQVTAAINIFDIRKNTIQKTMAS